MKNLVLFLLLVCTLHGICVSLKCYNCTFWDVGCHDVSMSAPSDVATCPDGSMCHTSTLTDSSGNESLFIRGCVPDSECVRGCVTMTTVLTATFCNYCCSEDHCNSELGAPTGGDFSCYTCMYTNTDEIGSSACSNHFNPRDETIRTITCPSGQCAIIHDKEWSKEVYRGCPVASYPCRSEPYCQENGSCVECCSSNLCNGQASVLPASTATPQLSTASQLSTAPTLSTLSLLSTINSTSKVLTNYVAKIVPKGLTGPGAARAPTTSLTDQDETGKGNCLSKYSFDILILSVTGILLKWSIN